MDATSRDAREALPGWAWVGAGGVLLVAVPMWILLTAAVIQLTPDLRMDGEPTAPWWQVWSVGGAWGVLALLLLLGVVGTLVGVGAVGGRIAAFRARSARAAFDAAIDPHAVLEGVTLELRQVPTYDPRLDDAGRLPLSSPGTRLAAAAIDLALVATPFPLLALFAIVVAAGGPWPALTSDHLPPGIATFVAACAVVSIIVVVVQHALAARGGQTVGKRLLGLRVVSTDGRDVSFLTAVVLRWWAWALVLGVVPVLGWVVGPLVDLVLLFGRDHRTLHDILAGTVVVDVR